MSASRLEQFNACPFRHFVTYGLRAAERPESRERPADLGAFYHEALCAVFRRAQAEGLSPRSLTPAQQQSLLDAVLPEVIAAHHDGVLLGNERLRAVLFLLVETLRRSVAAIVAQLAAGGFDIAGTEVRFGEGCAFPPIELVTAGGRRALLYGVIDRVDRAGDACRVVDYKTGGRALDFAAIADGSRCSCRCTCPPWCAPARAARGCTTCPCACRPCRTAARRRRRSPPRSACAG